MTPSSHTLATVVQKLTETHGEAKATSLFMQFLKKNHLSAMLPNILAHLKQRQKMSNTNETLFVTASTPLSSSALDAVSDVVHQKTGRVPKETVFAEDKSLIGGFVGTYGELVFDGSVRTLLNRLVSKK